MFYPSIVFPEDDVLPEKGGGGTGHLTDAAFRRGLAKDSISVCVTVRLRADAGMRLMPGRRGRVVKVDCHAVDLMEGRDRACLLLQFLCPLVLHTCI